MATSEIPVPPGHPFYEALEELLKEHHFDDFVEQRCTKFGRTEVRGHSNVIKRLLIQAGAFNLGMVLRKQVGAGTPRGLQAQVLRAMLLVFGLFNATKQLIGEILGNFLGKFRMQTSFTRRAPESLSRSNLGTFATGC